jgi:hypothetical protein
MRTEWHPDDWEILTCPRCGGNPLRVIETYFTNPFDPERTLINLAIDAEEVGETELGFSGEDNFGGLPDEDADWPIFRVWL